MRRLARYIFTLCVALSLVLCVSADAPAATSRSHFVQVHYRWPKTMAGFWSFGGRLYFCIQRWEQASNHRLGLLISHAQPDDVAAASADQRSYLQNNNVRSSHAGIEVVNEKWLRESLHVVGLPYPLVAALFFLTPLG